LSLLFLATTSVAQDPSNLLIPVDGIVQVMVNWRATTIELADQYARADRGKSRCNSEAARTSSTMRHGKDGTKYGLLADGPTRRPGLTSDSATLWLNAISDA
jgi:hypothetical protein